MSVRDIIKKSILNSEMFGRYDMGKIAAALAAVLLGGLIYYIYQKFYTGVVFLRSFAATLVGMTVLTAMVTVAISSNIVISLGMVGALSIVRYRTAIKDPMDLLYLFWAITTGITAGAGMYVLAVIHYKGDETGDKILQSFGKMKYFIKSRTMKGENTEMAVEVFCKREDFTFMENIRNLDGCEDITLIQYNGEYHG